MKVIEINHTVRDFNQWKAVFDEFPPKVGGATFHRIDRNVDNPNNITVLAGFATTEAARAFADNPDLKKAMDRAGVTGTPRIEIYDEVESVQY